jgi:hypothetical protein
LETLTVGSREVGAIKNGEDYPEQRHAQGPRNQLRHRKVIFAALVRFSLELECRDNTPQTRRDGMPAIAAAIEETATFSVGVKTSGSHCDKARKRANDINLRKHDYALIQDAFEVDSVTEVSRLMFLGKRYFGSKLTPVFSSGSQPQWLTVMSAVPAKTLAGPHHRFGYPSYNIPFFHNCPLIFCISCPFGLITHLTPKDTAPLSISAPARPSLFAWPIACGPTASSCLGQSWTLASAILRRLHPPYNPSGCFCRARPPRCRLGSQI